jgi:hypothetical protein
LHTVACHYFDDIVARLHPKLIPKREKGAGEVERLKKELSGSREELRAENVRF